MGKVFACANQAVRGGYVLADSDNVDVVLVATGSEVSLALKLRKF